ncbi:FAD-dependent monooxygenase [Candidatus Symbiobacter mobilis]|uniref:Salicylate hydroxylase n=1 Tax=Candidatus Symbiobacter mobilis CR TaxID=946483 RepID=U5N8Y9_9BURK|nr:FAD-dependent monooxygenase [Candidatus Symbiobacter mobilis]AGX86659.1 salicylate hydroxylase [Candidatus Symbiobacter mobilis CR]
MEPILVAGGGLGGLSTTLACATAGADVFLYERSPEFQEFGAGIQLGPNVVRVLHEWGLGEALNEVVSFPDRLQFRCAATGTELGVLRLGSDMSQRYGAPYLTIHRGDMMKVLLDAVRTLPNARLFPASPVVRFEQSEFQVRVHLATEQAQNGLLLVGADGAWSDVRKQLLDDGAPQPIGHLAYRALISQARLPLHLRSSQITVWLGPKMHVVQYPVRRGELLNVVVIVHGNVYGDLSHWDHSGNANEVRTRMAVACKPLHDMILAVPNWKLWALCVRTPMRAASEHTAGRVALVGDAAHPMVPYLAQGAAMAFEDSYVLARVLKQGGVLSSSLRSTSKTAAEVPKLLHSFAEARWKRNAKVQSRALRNGKIFHATGLIRLGRNASMQMGGEGLLDQPWLYGATL